MASICCGVVGEGDSNNPIEPSSRSSTRRSLDLLPLKYIADMAVSPTESNRKRQKLGHSSSPAPPRDCEHAVVNRESGGGAAGRRMEEQKNNIINRKSKEEQKNNSIKKESKEEQEGFPVSLPSRSEIPALKSSVLENEVVVECPKYGVTSICGRRRDMEDAVSVCPSFFQSEKEKSSQNKKEFHFFGVYDGHGCSHVATMCKERLHGIVKEEIENSQENLEWKLTMEKSFTRMDQEVQSWSHEGKHTSTCRCELQTPHCDAVGSTAVVAVITPEKIVVSNCGDSRAVLCRNGVATPLSSDHKPDRPDELLRVQAAGGRVIYWDGPRVLGVLAMSRAIGDNYLKPYVISEPEVTVTDRSDEDECLILASDGLWDVVSNETACGVVRMCLQAQKPPSPPGSPGRDVAADGSDKACSDASILLTKLALARHSSDNVSVVVIDLRRGHHQQRKERKE